MGKIGSSECQRPAENWANRPQEKSIVLLDGREWLAPARFVLPKPEFLLSTICLCCTIIWTQVDGGFNTKGKWWDSWASPGAGGERLFSLTKDVRSQGSGKSCCTEFKSASCREAHLWLVEEASFSSSVAWSSCRWDRGSSRDSCDTGGGGGDGVKYDRRRQTCTENYTHLWWTGQWSFLWWPLHSESITKKKNQTKKKTKKKPEFSLFCKPVIHLHLAPKMHLNQNP